MDKEKRKHEIKTSIMKTLSSREVFNGVAKLSQIKDYILSAPQAGRILIDELEEALDELHYENQIHKFDEFISNVSRDLSEKVSTFKAREMIAREKFKSAKENFAFFSKLSFVKYLGVVGDVAKGLASSSDKTDIFIIVLPESEKLTKRLLDFYMRIKGIRHKYNIREIRSAKDNKFAESIEMGFNLLNFRAVINKDYAFEKLISRNLWVFNYFVNFPFEKITDSFKINSHEKEEKASLVVQLMNKLA